MLHNTARLNKMRGTNHLLCEFLHLIGFSAKIPWVHVNLPDIKFAHRPTPAAEAHRNTKNIVPSMNVLNPELLISIFWTAVIMPGSTEEYWGRQDAAQAIALVLWKGLGLDEGNDVGSWQGSGEKVLLGIGGGHYAPRHMDIAVKDGVWVGHLLSGYSLPMEVPPQGNGKSSGEVGGMWKHSIKVSYEATKAAFPGGEVIAHLDQKSFKGWQKNAITSYLQGQNIRIGKPNDFF